MTPEYLYQLADIADPDQLWKTPLLSRLDMPVEKRQRLDTGVALRRHARDIQRLNELLVLRKSLLITPLSQNGSATMTVDTPPEHVKLYPSHQNPGEQP